MYTLILDTSTDSGFAAIALDSKRVADCHFHTRMQGSRDLVALIDGLLRSLRIDITDLKAIGVSVGPGSFTGIRIAAAIAQGVAAGGALPLIGFSSLEGLISMRIGRFASVIGARTGGAFVMIREREGEQIHEITPATFYSYESLNDHLALCQEAVTNALLPVALHCPLVVIQSNLPFIAKIVESKYARGDFSAKLNLIYLRECPYSTLSS